MKKLVKVLLLVLLINFVNSFVYAGPGDFPRPDSLEPITITMNTSIY